MHPTGFNVIPRRSEGPPVRLGMTGRFGVTYDLDYVAIGGLL